MTAVRPRDAASLILLDYKGKKPYVLMGKRHPGHSFMPSKFVFPGGRLDALDRRIPVSGTLNLHVESKLCEKVTKSTSLKARALALTALRETFEETGIVIGETGLGPYQAPSGTPWEIYEKKEIWPSLDGLDLVARAITPPHYPKRFDTRFFLCDSKMIAHQEPGFAGPESEFVELAWVTIEEAKKLDIPSITGMILTSLSEQLEAGLAPYRPIPFYRTKYGIYTREFLSGTLS